MYGFHRTVHMTFIFFHWVVEMFVLLCIYYIGIFVSLLQMRYIRINATISAHFVAGKERSVS